MLLTAIECSRQNIEFAAVHDSYWTHAATVDEMNGILRDKFVELHENALLENVKCGLEEMHPKLKGLLPDPPEMGTLDLEQVKKSTFFFH
mmetsp:Transcript_25653/g.59380  ORF Transcript_25653/g.59380 Transcript_25653/m.59380 type:complete len:90 (+) Transcript_25653:2288-2557(+)